MLNIRIPEEDLELRPRITVVGLGGAGSNGVNNMISSGLQGVEFLVCNTDAQSLKMSLSERKIQMGTQVTRGLGAGARPDIGRAAAEEAMDEIMGYIEGSNMVFITAGMGGGSGTGSAPAVARACREAGILTVGVVTKPFHFEGAHRMRLADAGIEELQQHVDTLLIIPNQNLFRVANEKTTFADAFKMADEVLHAGVRGVTDLMVMPGLINLDFADIRSVMSEMGKAMMGTGESQSERRAVDAAEAAISNPLLEDASMQGAKGLLVNITGGMDMTLYEVDEAMNRIRDEVDPDANIIFGSTFNPELDGKIRVSVVATGIDGGMRAFKTPGSTGFSPEIAQPQQPQSPYGAPKAPINPNTFGRGVTLRQGAGQPTAPVGSSNSGNYNQGSAVSNTQTPTTRNTGTGTPTGARATAMANNPGFFSRAAAASAARRVEEYYEPAPLTVGALEEETADDFYQDFTAETVEAPVVQQQPQRAAYQPQQQSRPLGEREDNFFIPPEPMVAAEPAKQSHAPAPQQQRHIESFAENELSAPRATYQEAPVYQEPQHAPVATKQAAPKAPEASAKRPGLFDRLAGTVRQEKAPAPAPAQPVLTVDNSDRIPAIPASFDDDLDIPAFLRRQAN
jgi:cell division protein FtsZ